MSNYTSLVDEVKQTLFSANADDDLTAISSGIKKCDKYLRVMRTQLSRTTLLWQKNHLEASIGHLLGFRQMFKALQVFGSGHSPHPKTAKNRVQWVDQPSAFASRMRTGLVVNLSHKDVGAFLDDAFVMLRRRINNILKTYEAVKLNAVFCGEFVVQKAQQELVEFKYFTVPQTPIFRDTNLQEWCESILKINIAKQLEEFQERDSGWSLKTIVNVTFNINNYNPMRHGGSSYIDLPDSIKATHACINVKNNDEACFAWAVTSALHPVQKSADRPSSYPDCSTVLNLKGIMFPMSLKQIRRFEELNDISINVYSLLKQKKKKEKFTVVPCRLTDDKQSHHVNILLIQDKYSDEDSSDSDDDDEDQPRYHYVWIKNLSRLVYSQLSKYHAKKYICDRCLHYFYSERQLQIHEVDCTKMNDCAIRMPEEGKNSLFFKNYMNKERLPFMIYADLESLLIPTKDKVRYQEHKPCSVGYYVKCSYDASLSFYKKYTGPDCTEWFTREMAQFAEDLEPVFLRNVPMTKLSEQQELDFNSATTCHICEKVFLGVEWKVRDHDHLTGQFRGAAHNGCNLNYRDKNGKVNIPIAFHNFSGYDSHFIISDLATKIEGRVELLPVNKEKFISVTKHITGNLIKLRFIDTYRFQASGLDKLASSLVEYPVVKSEFKEFSEDQLNLLTRKGVFPYEHLDSWEKLEETQLPDITSFNSKLNNCNISQADYEHAQNVWNTFKIKNMCEYTELYLKTDVLLLADVFERFRTCLLNTHKLDPAYYFTLPGFTWDAMLKYTGINLELLTDIDMAMFVERGIRGGLSQCSKRHAKANNKYMQSFDSTRPSNYLMYFDVNNQYGWSMSQHLPYGGFEWVENSQNFNVFDIADDSDTGFILEVDLNYPEHLHDAHSDLPFCPVHDSVPNTKEKKLLATLDSKERYVIHYRSLKHALSHGLEVAKIHHILKFKQSAWLKRYIDLNTTLRQASTTEFEKNLYKLMNNAVFGKTMENVRKYSIVKLVHKWDGRYGAEALISSPTFKSSMTLAENLTIIELNKSEIFLNKPIYVGMAILDLAKLTTYGFHYDFMKVKFGDDATVCYTDTDSLIYDVACDDIYKIIAKDCVERFDTSDYSANNGYGIPLVNKKVLGMMKDENNGDVMTEFVGLRSKMYATRVEGVDKDKKAKGVKTCIVKNRITFNDYLDCLYNKKDNIVQQHLIRSVKHNVSTIVQNKIALSPHDTKRFICKDGVNTLAWGYHSIINL